MIDIPIGAFIFWKNIKTFQSSLQRFWTNTIYSHTSIYAGYGINRDFEFEASTLVLLSTYNRRNLPKNDIIAFKDVPEKIRIKALEKIIKEYEGELYGFISWLTIFLRYLFQKIGFKNVHKWNILWGWGVICSELIWYYMIEVISEMMLTADNNKWTHLFMKINEYNPDTFAPQDLKDIIDSYPLCFEWITAKLSK